MIVKRVTLAHIDNVEVAGAAALCPGDLEMKPAEVALGIGVCPQEEVVRIVCRAYHHVQVPVLEIRIEPYFISFGIRCHALELTPVVAYGLLPVKFVCEKAIIEFFGICETVKFREFELISALRWFHIVFVHLK